MRRRHQGVRRVRRLSLELLLHQSRLPNHVDLLLQILNALSVAKARLLRLQGQLPVEVIANRRIRHLDLRLAGHHARGGRVILGLRQRWLRLDEYDVRGMFGPLVRLVPALRAPSVVRGVAEGPALF